MHCGYVVKVENIRPHSNADRLQIATFFGNDTIVDLNVKIGDKGVYFPSDLQLSEEYCEVNNLVRKKDANGKDIGGYLDPCKRNIKAIKLRGEKSDGIFMPIHTLNYCFADPNKEITIVAGQADDKLNIGDIITIVNGHEICKKYIPKTQVRAGSYSEGNRTRKVKVDVAPLFAEHADTEQLAYNLSAFKSGDEIEISLKMHGTSQRTGYLPVLKGYKRTLLDKIFHREGKPVYDWGYVSGTRRTVLNNFDGGYYGSNEFREAHSKFFEGKLNKGEEVFYEVVGFTHTGAPIMASCLNKKLNDPEFSKMYGPETVFSYGCCPEGKKMMHGTDEYGDFSVPVDVPQSDIYVYRMTMTNEDGFTVEYTPDFMRYRCEQMGVKTVPVFWSGRIPEECEDKDFIDADLISPPGEWVKELAEVYYDGPDPVGKTHVREGVVVRIINRPKFCAYKHKNWSFKCLSGMALEQADLNNISEDILTEM
jgi:hypothetical protein